MLHRHPNRTLNLDLSRIARLTPTRMRRHCLLLCIAWGCVAATAPAEPPAQTLGDEAYELLRTFYDYDRSEALDARIVLQFDRGNALVEKVVFRSRDTSVAAFLARPKKPKAPHACVLLLHGLGLDKMDWWEDDNDLHGGNLTKALFDAGIAVLTPDAQYHGERSHYNRYDFPVALGFEAGKGNRFRDMIVQSVVDCRRAIDYLETRDDIDHAKIGVLGYSLGGIETFALTALDPRIQASVACVTPAGHLDRMGFTSAVLPRTFAARVGDRPFLMLMGRRDHDSCGEAQAKRLFDRIGGSKKKLVWYESGHILPESYVLEAKAWLAEALQ